MTQRIAAPASPFRHAVLFSLLLAAGLATYIHEPARKPARPAEPMATVVVPAVQAVLAPEREPLPLPSLQVRVDSPLDNLRHNVRWLPVRLGEATLHTPDVRSRLLLVQSAAQRAGLREVGLSHRDVYGIINAETSWIPRLGASKDGTPNLGIAQFEPATARAIGLANPGDPVEAVHAAALHMKDAALWSAKRIAGLRLSNEEHAQKLREGVSIYYNLSTRGRNVWDGKNTARLPVETQRHIANAREGTRIAAELEAQLQALKGRMSGERTTTAALQQP